MTLGIYITTGNSNHCCTLSNRCNRSVFRNSGNSLIGGCICNNIGCDDRIHGNIKNSCFTNLLKQNRTDIQHQTLARNIIRIVIQITCFGTGIHGYVLIFIRQGYRQEKTKRDINYNSNNRHKQNNCSNHQTAICFCGSFFWFLMRFLFGFCIGKRGSLISFLYISFGKAAAFYICISSGNISVFFNFIGYTLNITGTHTSAYRTLCCGFGIGCTANITNNLTHEKYLLVGRTPCKFMELIIAFLAE